MKFLWKRDKFSWKPLGRNNQLPGGSFHKKGEGESGPRGKRKKLWVGGWRRSQIMPGPKKKRRRFGEGRVRRKREK